jgi:hypothetical protein
MTEVEWLACADPEPMLVFLRDKASDRRRRLFAVACCRRIRHLMSDDWSLRAVDVAERLADDLAANDEVVSARAGAAAIARRYHDRAYREEFDVFPYQDRYPWSGGPAQAAYAAEVVLLRAAENPRFGFVADTTRRAYYDIDEKCCDLCLRAVRAEAWFRAFTSAEQRDYETLSAARDEAHDRAESDESPHLASLVREVYGNPFRSALALADAILAWNNGAVRRIAEAIYSEGTFDRVPILADALQEAGFDNADILNHCRGPGPHVRGCWVVDLLLDRK